MLNEELDIQGQEAVQNAEKVLLSFLDKTKARRRTIAWDAPRGLLPTRIFLAHIIL